MVLALLNAIFVFVVTRRIQYSLHTHLCHTTAYRHYNILTKTKNSDISTLNSRLVLRGKSRDEQEHTAETPHGFGLSSVIPGRRNTKIPKILAACSSAVARIDAAKRQA